MRRFFRNLYLDLAGLLAKPAPGIHILNGHILAREDGDPELFRRLLKKLQQEVRFMRIEEAVDRIQRQDLPTEPCIAFTFDDGFEEQYTGIAPVLEQFGIHAAFFILPGFIDGNDDYQDQLYRKVFSRDAFLTAPKSPVTWDQVRELQQRGHVIGSHGLDHLNLDTDDPELLHKEIVTSKQIIEEKTNRPCFYFAYPSGGTNDISKIALEIAQKHYKNIFSQSNYKHYFSFSGSVINRRHFEPFWPVNHVKYFLRVRKQI